MTAIYHKITHLLKCHFDFIVPGTISPITFPYSVFVKPHPGTVSRNLLTFHFVLLCITKYPAVVQSKQAKTNERCGNVPFGWYTLWNDTITLISSGLLALPFLLCRFHCVHCQWVYHHHHHHRISFYDDELNKNIQFDVRAFFVVFLWLNCIYHQMLLLISHQMFAGDFHGLRVFICCVFVCEISKSGHLPKGEM